MMNPIFEYQDWGLIEYVAAWKKQEEIFKKVIDSKCKGIDTNNILVFCEHPHVYTLGKSGQDGNMLIDLIQLKAKQADFVHTNRGGDITYHGPGQLVGYPIFDLEAYGIGLKKYIYLLEESIIRLLREYAIEAGRIPGAMGVWIEPDSLHARKICAIGVRSSRYVTMHGFALNVNTNLDYFKFINPCGFIDKGVTSIQQETGIMIDLKELKSKLLNIIYSMFQ